MTDIQGLYIDYAPDGTEDDELLRIKERVQRLDVPSKNIWLLYCENGCTYSAVARILHSSPPTVKRKIERIRERILGNG